MNYLIARANPKTFSQAWLKHLKKFSECDLTFDHASTLYTHVAGKHYYNQLVELYKANFMRTDGMCTGCPNRPINDVQVSSL